MKVVIDGNIGAGKTTQLNILEKKGFSVQREPIEQWPLEDFYKDPSRWSFYFHMVILRTLQPVSDTGTIFIERSLLSSRYVFWPLLVDKGLVSPGEDSVYSYFYEKFKWEPDIYIFLSKTPENSFMHIQNRQQDGDSDISFEYLEELDNRYKKLLKTIKCPVIIIDANKTPEEIHNEIIANIFPSQ